MKILQKAQLKIFGLLTALLLVCASVFMGVGRVSRASADVNSDAIPETVQYIDTNVEAIGYWQQSECVFFGFKLTESDYSDYGLFEDDFGGKPAYSTYEKYIALWLTYWKNFPKMNSAGVRFDQLYAYWNGSSVGQSRFADMVTHRSTLKLLEYGFVINIPAGTTFPSMKYVIGNCEGDPIMYRTTEAKAFYFNGSAFTEMPYQVAVERSEAITALNSTNLNSYYGEKDTVGRNEKAQVQALIETAKKEIGLSFSSFAVQDVLARFEIALAEIMTKEDYAELAESKAQAKAALAAYFTDFEQNNIGNYETEDWNSILAIKGEYGAMIDGLASIAEVNAAVIGVKFAVGSVMNKEVRAGFADYCEAAASRVENAFNASLYRAEEQAQGAALVAEGKDSIAKANSYGEVDAVSADYITRIGALKTKAQWEAEEANREDQNNQENNTPPSSDSTVGGESTSETSGCGGVTATGAMLATAVLGVAMVIKKKKEKDGIEE